jgi:hypothetical protein
MQDWMTLDEPAALAEAVSAGGPAGPTEPITLLQTSVRLPPVEGVQLVAGFPGTLNCLKAFVGLPFIEMGRIR